MIIWVASYPRSGNTMVRLLLKQGFGYHCKSIYCEGPTRYPEGFNLKTWNCWGSVTDVGPLRRDSEVHFLKTHEPPSDDCPTVYVVRDGRDVMVSYAHFLCDHEPQVVKDLTFEQVLERVILGQIGIGSWTHHVNAWRDRSAPTVWIRYEELVDRPYPTLAAALLKLGHPIQETGAPPPEFGELSSLMPTVFRKGRPGAWREELPPRLADLFLEEHGATLQELGYPTAPHPSNRVDPENGVTRFAASVKAKDRTSRARQELDDFRNQLRAKEVEIRTLAAAAEERLDAMRAKEVEIRTLAAAAEERLDAMRAKEAKIRTLAAAAEERLDAMGRLDAEAARLRANREELQRRLADAERLLLSPWKLLAGRAGRLFRRRKP